MEKPAYSYTYTSSRWSGYVMLLLFLMILVIVASSFANRTAKLEATLFLLAVAALFAFLGLRVLLHKGPELQFGKASIWTLKLGDTKWQQVTLKFSHVTTGKAGTIYTLKILDQTTRQQLDWVALGTTEAETERIKGKLKLIRGVRFS